MLQFKTQTEKGNHQPFLQAKLKIGQPGDKYERQADAVANRVMRMSDTNTMQMQPMEEEETAQPKLMMQPKIQMQEEEETAQTKLRRQPLDEEEMMQAKAKTGGGYASSEIANQINSTKGNGRPLSSRTNQFMNNAFGANFSDVKIHTGSQAVHMNQQLGAQAFTIGNDIYFNKGEYNPNNSNGKSLLAHELTHVVQQQGGMIQRNTSVTAVPARTDTRFGLGIRNRFGLYDAELNRNSRTLTLKMRIAFNYTGAWPSDAAKTNWGNEFKRLVENRWSYRYYLVPDGTCRYSEDQTTHFARINIEAVTSNPHYTVNVAYTTSNIQSSANSVSRTANLDSMDTLERTRRRLGVDFQQVGVEHEFGHMLGLAHIECDVTTGTCPAGDQYGDTVAERGDIMGSGWVVTKRDYLPFVTAMYYFTGCNWSASHEMQRQLGDFPLPSETERYA